MAGSDSRKATARRETVDAGCLVRLPDRPVLGGSTIAAAAGIDPWCSQVELYYRLRGELPEPEGEQLEWGRRVQPLIFAALRERGYEAHETPGVELHDDSLPWLVGHPDGIADDGLEAHARRGTASSLIPLQSVQAKRGEARIAQNRAVLPQKPGTAEGAATVAPSNLIVEAKLTGGYGYRKGDGLPLNWQAQVQVYMLLGHVKRAIVAVLTAGIRLDVHELHFDERAASLLIEQAEEFVGYLRRGQAPLPDGSESARRALLARFPSQAPGRVYRLTGAEWDYAKELCIIRESKKALEARETLLENLIKAADPEAETFIDPCDGTFATWKEVTSKRLDTKLLRSERPELADLFTRETSTRRFTIHE